MESLIGIISLIIIIAICAIIGSYNKRENIKYSNFIFSFYLFRS